MRRITMTVLCAMSCVAAVRGSSAQQQAGKPATINKTVVAAEQDIWEMFKRNDFDRLIKAVGRTIDVEATGINMAVGPLPTVKDFDGLVTKSYSVDSVSTRAFGSDVVVVTARVTVDRSYKDSTGNSSQTPSPIYTMTVWQRTGGKWVPIAHSETPVMSPQGKAGDGASPQSHD